MAHERLQALTRIRAQQRRNGDAAVRNVVVGGDEHVREQLGRDLAAAHGLDRVAGGCLAAQQQELERLTHQLAALHRVLTASLALAKELQAGTIEKVLAKDDVELALEFLLGKRKP